jgi:hypothetical protein
LVGPLAHLAEQTIEAVGEVTERVVHTATTVDHEDDIRTWALRLTRVSASATSTVRPSVVPHTRRLNLQALAFVQVVALQDNTGWVRGISCGVPVARALALGSTDASLVINVTVAAVDIGSMCG